uniref:Uncharacterized protein n=4 Tax=Clastoptera arizonana TaxID=38151 RepID=A0A1B6DJX3_9HEMI
MNLISDVKNVFNLHALKTSLIYCSRNGVIKFTFHDISNASTIIKFKIDSTFNNEVDLKSSNKCIALFMHLNYLYPIFIYGILLSGQTFVCMDESAPFDLIENNLSKLNISAIILTDILSKKISHCLSSFQCVDTFTLLGFTFQIWISECKNKYTQRSFLYAVQTSGSTGLPKIVCVPEACILPNITQLRNEFAVTQDDVILSASPFTFDPSIIELFLTFTTGASLFMVSDEIKAIPNDLLHTLFCTNHKPITIIQMTPTVFCRWSSKDIQEKILNLDSKLKVLALGGEQFPHPNYFKEIRSTGNKTKIYNLYGTTEVSCWSMISNGEVETLGVPMSETTIQVKDKDGNLITDGVGELVIGSSSRICQINDEILPEGKNFIFRPTGDLVQVAKSKYKYLARKDNVIKRWGHKVSLDEVTSSAMQCKGTSIAFCVLDKMKRIVLFVNSNDRISEHLKKNLKKASLPDIILVIPNFPLTKHGKIDKKVLEQLANEHFELEIKTKSFGIIDFFKILWERYTNSLIDSSGFIDSGGNSISALQIISEMSFRFPMTSPDMIKLLLQNNTLNQCCDLLNGCIVKNHDKTPDKRKFDSNVSKGIEKKLKFVEPDRIYSQCKGRSYGDQIIKNHYLTKQISLEFVWKYDLGKCVDASPTLIHYKKENLSLVAVGSHSGKLAVFQLHSGINLWEINLHDRIESSVSCTNDGLCGIVGCYNGKIYCFNLKSGEIKWVVKTQEMVKCTPLVIDERIIVGSYDYHVYCLAVSTGKIEWKYKTSGSVLASPVYSKLYGLILIANLKGSVMALKPDSGQLCWDIHLGSPVFSTPAIISWKEVDHLIIAEVNGFVNGVSINNSGQVWSYKVNSNIFSSITCQKTESTFLLIFGCHDHNIYCLKATETYAELIWKINVDSPVYATPVTASFPFIVSISTNGCVFVLDFKNGEIKCKYDVKKEMFSSPIVFQSKIVCGCRDNNLYSFKINYLT